MNLLVLVLDWGLVFEDEDETAMNLELRRRRRQGAAGILPAVLFSGRSAGKMPAALSGSWKALSALRSCIGTMNRLVLVLEDKPPNR